MGNGIFLQSRIVLLDLFSMLLFYFSTSPLSTDYKYVLLQINGVCFYMSDDMHLNTIIDSFISVWI